MAQQVIALVGLGYVGLPLAVEFGKHFRTIGPHLKRGAIVVHESTVYPGAKQEVCIPELERASGMKWKEGFFVG